MIALVLAAGLGTRFRPATETTPKPLLPFLGRPILHHLFDHLLGQGVDRFVVNSHHLAAKLEREVGTSWKGVPVAFSREEEILGTAGAIRRAAERGLLGDGPFLVVNGDLYTDLPIGPLVEAVARKGTVSALAVLPNGAERETPLWGDGQSWLSGIGPGQGAGATGPWLFTGIQVALPALLERIPPGRSELARDVLVPSLAREERVFRLVPSPPGRFWFDLGTPERLAAAEKRVAAHLRGAPTSSSPSPTRKPGSSPSGD